MKSWKLKTYVNDQFTDLVRVPASIRSLIIANTTAGSIDASMRIANNGVEQAIVLSTTAIPANESKILDLCELNLNLGDDLQVLGSAAGLHFIASGSEVKR